MSAKCPVPIVYCGYEAGMNIMAGSTLETCPEEHPVRMAYTCYLNGGFLRNSWDLVTAYYALEPTDKKWILSDECSVKFRDNATTVQTEGKEARFVQYTDEETLVGILNSIIADPKAE